MGKKVAEIENTVAASDSLEEENMDSDNNMDNDIPMGDDDTKPSIRPGGGEIVR